MSTRDDPTEVARHLEYLASLTRRQLAQATRARALAGSRTARAALADAWAPVTRPHLLTEPERAPLPAPVPEPTVGYPPAYPAIYGG